MARVAALRWLPAVAAAFALGAAQPGSAQPAPGDASALPTYKIPPRGAPGSRIGGASRSMGTGALPTIDLLAPSDHAGQTAMAAPSLYYFVSGPTDHALQLTVSSPGQPRPVVETRLPPPREAGVHSLRLADYHVQLQPGMVYVWSVSIAVDPRSHASDIVASAPLLRAAGDPALDGAVRSAPPPRRAALLAAAGLWYDAVAAAAEAESLDHHAALDTLLDQVGLAAAARYDRQAAAGGR